MTETFVAFVLPVFVSFIAGILVDRGILNKKLVESVRNVKRTALQEYVANAEDSKVRDLVEIYLEREDTSLFKKDVVEKN